MTLIQELHLALLHWCLMSSSFLLETVTYTGFAFLHPLSFSWQYTLKIKVVSVYRAVKSIMQLNLAQSLKTVSGKSGAVYLSVSSYFNSYVVNVLPFHCLCSYWFLAFVIMTIIIYRVCQIIMKMNTYNSKCRLPR